MYQVTISDDGGQSVIIVHGNGRTTEEVEKLISILRTVSPVLVPERPLVDPEKCSKYEVQERARLAGKTVMGSSGGL